MLLLGDDDVVDHQGNQRTSGRCGVIHEIANFVNAYLSTHQSDSHCTNDPGHQAPVLTHGLFARLKMACNQSHGRANDSDGGEVQDQHIAHKVNV